MAGQTPEPLAVILHGRVEADAQIADLDTLVQMEAVGAALESLGFAVASMELGLDLDRPARHLREVRPALVFNLVEQIEGSDSLLPLAGHLLDHVGIPYSGASSAALAATTHKVAAKRVMLASGIPTPDWLEEDDVRYGLPHSPGPWIVKSVTEHASLGLCAAAIVDTERLSDRLRHSTRTFGGGWFAERFVDGREMNVSLLAGRDGAEVLPVAEIEFVGFGSHEPAIVGYAAKWEVESDAYRNTRRRLVGPDDAALTRRIGEIALECWDVFGLRGYARVDFRVDADGRPWVLEVNANPCLSPDAGFAAAAEAGGIAYPEIIARIIRDSGVQLPRVAARKYG